MEIGEENCVALNLKRTSASPMPLTVLNRSFARDGGCRRWRVRRRRTVERADVYRALWSWIICVAVTVIVSMFTVRKPAAELTGLVYGYTTFPKETELKLYQRPIFWAGGVAIFFAVLRYVSW